MAFEWIADFRPPLEASEDELRWSAFSRGFLTKLLEKEPRLRVRIRNLPQGIASTHSESREMPEEMRGHDGPLRAEVVVAKQPVALTSDDVPPILRRRLEIPRAGEFPVRTYRCMDCLDPATGKPGQFVPHIRKLIHESKGHKLKAGDVTHMGLRQTWTPDYQIFSASPKRLREQIHLMYGIAFTTIPEDPLDLRGYKSVVILPFRSLDRNAPGHVADPSDIVERIRKIVRPEYIRVLRGAPTADIESLIAFLTDIDSKALQLDAGEDEDADQMELEDQLRRDKAARELLAQTRRAAQEMGVAEAVAQATKGKSKLR